MTNWSLHTNTLICRITHPLNPWIALSDYIRHHRFTLHGGTGASPYGHYHTLTHHLVINLDAHFTNIFSSLVSKIHVR